MINGRELGLAVLTLRGSPAEAIITVGAAAGFDSVTLRLIEPKAGDHGHLVGDVSARRVLRQLMDDLGVGLLDVEVVRLRDGADVDKLLPALDAAAQLGARHVITVCEDAESDRFVESFVGLELACRSRGMRAVLEFMPFSKCPSFERAVRLVLRARNEGSAHGAGVLVDALHLERSGGTAQQVETYTSRFPELFPYVQLCDAPLLAPHGGVAAVRDEAVAGRLLPGAGKLLLAPLLAALPDGIPVCIETPVRSLNGLSDLEKATRAFASGNRMLQGTGPTGD